MEVERESESDAAKQAQMKDNTCTFCSEDHCTFHDSDEESEHDSDNECPTCSEHDSDDYCRTCSENEYEADNENKSKFKKNYFLVNKWKMGLIHVIIK